MLNTKKQLVNKSLIIYMISALLFLTFVKLHIHTPEAAMTEAHGSAVAISTLADHLANDFNGSNVDNEILINPDSILKVNQLNLSLFAVFLLLTVFVSKQSSVFIGRLRQARHKLSTIPFHGTPLLRGPPL